MTSASPAEFLTFMRTATRPASACLRQSLSRTSLQSSIASRSFAAHSPLRATGNTQDKKHATDKADQLDVQSANSGEARAAKDQGAGGTATEQSDSRNNTERAKKDHPEAPDVVIGMQDERGKKGH